MLDPPILAHIMILVFITALIVEMVVGPSSICRGSGADLPKLAHPISM
jgi:hypothetical protein